MPAVSAARIPAALRVRLTARSVDAEALAGGEQQVRRRTGAKPGVRRDDDVDERRQLGVLQHVLGSHARRDHGAAEWLPGHEAVALSVRETAHGLKVLYRDGRLVEVAVFDLDEIGLAGVNRYRVLLDRGGVEERVREVAARPPQQPSDEHLFGMFVASVQVGAGRARRGERLSGAFFRVWGTRYLCALLARAVPAPDRALLDGLDALRRFERV